MTLPVVLERWLSHDVRDLLDEDGRPLGEAASPLYPASTREVRCPYPGARHGKPMNATALAQVRRAMPRCEATLARAAGPDPTVAALFTACARIAVTPQLLLAGAPIPAALSALFKINVGLMQTVTSLLLDSPGLAKASASSLGAGGAFVAALEQGEWLLGRRQVCAGSPAEIGSVWEAFTGQRSASAAEPVPLAADGAGAWACAATGLSIALVLATQSRMIAGDRAAQDEPGAPGPLGVRLWSEPRPSWMAAATARPERRPSAAANLFQEVPPALARFLEREASRDHVALEQLFRECVPLLPPHE